MSRGILLRRVVPVMAMALLIGACQTTTPVPEFTDWKTIPPGKSVVSFVGDKQPEITRSEFRWYKGSVWEERHFLVSDSDDLTDSHVRVAVAPTFFSPSVTEELRNERGLLDVAIDGPCRRGSVTAVKHATNVNGPFIYTTCWWPRSDHNCLMAWQGFGGVSTGDRETRYRSWAEWIYCTTWKDEADILKMLASLRVKE